jgi:hypothetical protein
MRHNTLRLIAPTHLHPTGAQHCAVLEKHLYPHERGLLLVARAGRVQLLLLDQVRRVVG